MSIWGNARVRSFAIKIAAGSRVGVSGTLSFFKTIINRNKTYISPYYEESK